MDNSSAETSLAFRDKNSTLTLVLIGIVIILCLGVIVVVIGYVGLTTGTNVSNSTVVSSTVSTNTAPSIVAEAPSIKILTPLVNSIVNGEVEVSGTSTYHFSSLQIELWDYNDRQLAVVTILTPTVSDSINEWQVQLDLTKSSQTSKGLVKVRSFEPLFTAETEVIFESYNDTPSNLIVYAPLKNQSIINREFLIRGEVKGLFEGTLLIRLKDSTNNVIYSEVVTVGDQYETFKEFSVNAVLESLPENSEQDGSLEFYYESAKDGTEVILQTIPVKFFAFTT